MKIAVIGATGTVGKAVVKEAAARGHEVTGFARNADKVQQGGNIRAVAFDVNAPDFAEQLKGFDAVVSAFNGGWDNPNGGADFAKGAAAITEAAKAAEVPYLLAVGGAGSLYIEPGVQLIDTPEFPKEIYDGANAARNWLKDLQQRRDVNWSFICPPPAFEGDIDTRSGSYRTGSNEVLFTGSELANISAPDLACAIVDDAERKGHLFERFTVAEAV
ncbi:NAD(P)-dependent oxidoreductase [Neisseria animalis]|uniref:NAD-dependent epimerase/dehydratase family protein n=1 Tax=Neisseria animalis TaxID=492 RepID=A0A5P3MSI4_NEIAN|nr:NAD(P)H-binding protein [Neisseria animalis]QEY23751.1 NAD-dependent epimerase/dehydratase family protein [Neisseria animalis]ROW32919.1 NAD-dependent epimerase/dehydratase family protein [Neisseria animalis]VEE09623.1 Putative NADH-flavin reductase [Neisseria animalis]